MTGRSIGSSRSRRAQPLRMSEPKVKAPSPAQVEAAALKAEATTTWADATGMQPGEWIGQLDPFVGPIIDRVLDALRAGAAVDIRGAWAIVTGANGKRLVVAGDLLRDALTSRPHR
jgi:hypothetical protein